MIDVRFPTPLPMKDQTRPGSRMHELSFSQSRPHLTQGDTNGDSKADSVINLDDDINLAADHFHVLLDSSRAGRNSIHI